jgi:hypothetical protein
MKYLIFLCFTILCHSCDPSASVKQSGQFLKKLKIRLGDKLGTITLNVPMEYDTSFSWVHYSDCNTCHVQKYRVQSKMTPILKESGFVWSRPKDSVDRFTISHNQYLPISTEDTGKSVSNH